MPEYSFETIRHLIAGNALDTAFGQARDLIRENPFRDQLLLLQNQFNHWADRQHKGLYPSEAERNRITFGFLGLLSDFEQKLAPTLAGRWQRDAETRLEQAFAKAAEFERPVNSTDTVLEQLERNSKKRYEQFSQLAIRRHAGDVDPEELAQLIEFWADQVTNAGLLPNHAVQLLTNLLRSSPKAILQLLNERRHREAALRVLQEQITREKARYDRLKTAGLAGLAGYWLSSFWNDFDPAHPFGSGYDDRGYDAKGFDPDGFDTHGQHRDGHSYLHASDGELTQAIAHDHKGHDTADGSDD